MAIPNKELVKTRFDKNLKNYKREAKVQKSISKTLADRVFKITGKNLGSILEIGCGTGFLTREICKQIVPKQLYLNDLVAEAFNETLDYMNGSKVAHCQFFEGDAETIEFPDKLDGIVSSSCFQWFSNLGLFLQKACKLLNTSGILAFSTFGKYHFKEIRHITGNGLEYKSLPDILELLNDKYEVLYAQEYNIKEEFSNPQDVLKHMKLTGVNGVGNVYFGRKKLEKFIQNYWKEFSIDLKKVYLTYHPIIVIAKKTGPVQVKRNMEVNPAIAGSVK